MHTSTLVTEVHLVVTSLSVLVSFSQCVRFLSASVLGFLQAGCLVLLVSFRKCVGFPSASVLDFVGFFQPVC